VSAADGRDECLGQGKTCDSATEVGARLGAGRHPGSGPSARDRRGFGPR